MAAGFRSGGDRSEVHQIASARQVGELWLNRVFTLIGTLSQALSGKISDTDIHILYTDINYKDTKYPEALYGSKWESTRNALSRWNISRGICNDMITW